MLLARSRCDERTNRASRGPAVVRVTAASLVAALLVCSRAAPTRAACLSVGQVATLRLVQRTVDGVVDPSLDMFRDFNVTLTVVVPDNLLLRAQRGDPSNAYTAWYRSDAARDR